MLAKGDGNGIRLTGHGMVVAVLFVALAFVIGFAPRGTEQYLHGWVPALICTAAFALGFRAYRAAGQSTIPAPWMLIGVGFGLFVFERVLPGLLGPELGRWIRPIASILGALSMAAGAWNLFRSLRPTDRARPVLDGLIAAAGMTIPVWSGLVKSFKAGETLGALELIQAIQPVVFALIVLLGIASLQSCGSARAERQVAVLAASSITLLGSLSFFQQVVGGKVGSSWFVWALGASAILFAVSAWRANSENFSDFDAVHDSDFGPEHSFIVVIRAIGPYLVSLTPLIVQAVEQAKLTGGVELPIVIFGLVLAVLALIRQVQVLVKSQSTLQDNELLTDKLRHVSDSLEKTVEQRTMQLQSLHQLTKAVTNTLDPNEVLSLAAVHSRSALHADAIVLWLAKSEGENEISLEGALQIGLNQRPDILALLHRLPPVTEIEVFPLPVSHEHGSAMGGCLLCGPLWGHQKLIGMMGAIRFNGSFHKTEFEMLESIGLETGTALVNSRMYAEAIQAADVDPVTGLYNHRAIHQRFDASLSSAKKEPVPIAVMMMDMNNFKMFNDTYGHPAGDEALRRVARSLAEHCEGKGYVGRYGGDEFLAVFPNLTSDQAAAVAVKVKERLEREGFVPNKEDKRVIPISLSFGIAMFPQDSKSRHDLIAIADANLYAAKRAGGGIRATSDTQRQNRELKSEHSFAVLDGMVTAVDNKDSYTRRHSEDVAEYAIWIAEELGLSSETIRTIRVGALLHDVGKICVPDEILRKPGRLTAEEFEILKRHPRLGALIVGGVAGMESIIDIVQHHHERWDGKGYPDQLEGTDIPMLGRLLAIADTFSAMTTDRPYRKGMDWDIALKEIRANIGTQFDPEMAMAFLRAAEKKQAAGQIPESINHTHHLPKAA